LALDALQQFLVGVNNSDVVVFVDKQLGKVKSHLSVSGNDNVHVRSIKIDSVANICLKGVDINYAEKINVLYCDVFIS
jgi:hypothetical protein